MWGGLYNNQLTAQVLHLLTATTNILHSEYTDCLHTTMCNVQGGTRVRTGYNYQHDERTPEHRLWPVRCALTQTWLSWFPVMFTNHCGIFPNSDGQKKIVRFEVKERAAPSTPQMYIYIFFSFFLFSFSRSLLFRNSV